MIHYTIHTYSVGAGQPPLPRRRPAISVPNRVYIAPVRPLRHESQEGGRPWSLYVRGMYGSGMPRPEVSAETKEEIEDLTDEFFRVPAHKVSFDERLEVLIEQVRTVQSGPQNVDELLRHE